MLQHVFTTTNVDWTGITDYWNWVRSMESSQGRGNRVVFGESSAFPSVVLASPEKYFTEEIMAQLEEAARKEFGYGS